MKKILIIEDEPQMRQNLATILEMEGFGVLAADDGQEGVALAKKRKPDLILCDVMMPRLDGYGVLQALRDDRGTIAIPFIFLTAKGERGDVRAGMNCGADDYLTKPVTADELLAAVGARFQRRKEQEETTIEGLQFRPNFESAKPLESLGLTPREAESSCGWRKESLTATSPPSSASAKARPRSTWNTSSRNWGSRAGARPR